MTNLMKIEQNLTMTSREIAELTGKQHKHVLEDTRKMLEDLRLTLADFSADLPDAYGRLQPAFALPKRETLILVSGYNLPMRAKIIDRWQELEAQVAKPMSQIEVLLASVQMLADVEKRLVAAEQQSKEVQGTVEKHETKFKSIESDVEELKDTNLLKVCPSNAEPITEIRLRINKQYGLSANVVNKVMSDTPHAPRAYGYVINQHPDANGSTFSVYLKRDVSDVFSRFVKECTQIEGSTRYEHPFIESKFKLNK